MSSPLGGRCQYEVSPSRLEQKDLVADRLTIWRANWRASAPDPKCFVDDTVNPSWPSPASQASDELAHGRVTGRSQYHLRSGKGDRVAWRGHQLI